LPTVVLDIDGTLVDSNYHHTIAWARAFERHGFMVPLWKIHRHMGMGGDQLVEAVAGRDVETSAGDDVRGSESELYGELIGEVRAFDGASEAMRDLRRAGWAVVLASSAKRGEVERYVEMLDATDIADDSTDSSDVDSTKPEPDLVEAALKKAAGGGDNGAVMVGDSVWDIKAASRAGVPAVAVLTGGFPEADLRGAGAIDVVESVRDLAGVLGRSLRTRVSN
jgi:phosphoglycolate phosphatase-like HAD superfamily hydrolase